MQLLPVKTYINGPEKRRRGLPLMERCLAAVDKVFHDWKRFPLVVGEVLHEWKSPMFTIGKVFHGWKWSSPAVGKVFHP